MQRPVLEKALIEWAKKPIELRKPLLLKGARQVGKTWLMKDFAKTHFENVCYINFEKMRNLISVFERNLDPLRITAELCEALRMSPLRPGKDILLLDEIQDCPLAVTSLKYFCEDYPELAVIAAGSLLGVRLGESSFPVGKIEVLEMFPMNFEEFLLAIADDSVLERLNHWQNMPEFAHAEFSKLFYRYLFVGGLPEAVATWKRCSADPVNAEQAVRSVHENLKNGYLSDMAKHAGKENAQHLATIWESAAFQLGETEDGKSQKFRFKGVIPRKKSFAELEGAISWLENAGLIIRCFALKRPEKPLAHFLEPNAFKIYIFDVGMLGYLQSLSGVDIVSQNYGLAKGFFIENYIAQALRPTSKDRRLYFWQNKTTEIDFVHLFGTLVVPIEIKTGIKFSTKSLDSYENKFSPLVSILSSPNPSQVTEDCRLKLSLYLAPFQKQVLELQ